MSRVKRLDLIANSAIDTLRASGIKAQRMTDEDLGRFFHEHLNPRSADRFDWSALQKLNAPPMRISQRSLLASSAIQTDYDESSSMRCVTGVLICW